MRADLAPDQAAFIDDCLAAQSSGGSTAAAAARLPARVRGQRQAAAVSPAPGAVADASGSPVAAAAGGSSGPVSAAALDLHPQKLLPDLVDGLWGVYREQGAASQQLLEGWGELDRARRQQEDPAAQQLPAEQLLGAGAEAAAAARMESFPAAAGVQQLTHVQRLRLACMAADVTTSGGPGSGECAGSTPLWLLRVAALAQADGSCSSGAAGGVEALLLLRALAQLQLQPLPAFLETTMAALAAGSKSMVSSAEGCREGSGARGGGGGGGKVVGGGVCYGLSWPPAARARWVSVSARGRPFVCGLGAAG